MGRPWSQATVVLGVFFLVCSGAEKTDIFRVGLQLSKAPRGLSKFFGGLGPGSVLER